MNLFSVYSEIKQKLSIPDENFDLDQAVNKVYISEPEEDKLEIVGDILNFVNKFTVFQDIKPLMNSLYSCITDTLEIKPESIYDFKNLLMKNTVAHFVQEYIDYSNLTQKNQVMKFLADSLEKLEIQPLIMNLGLLIKPMYQDQNYLSNLACIKEEEVNYNQSNGIEVDIKSEIDKWLKAQDIALSDQELLMKRMLFLLDRLLSKYKLEKNSETSKKLQTEVKEMLNMRLTMVSLMEQGPDDSYEPIPIK
ncbi:MAG: hypothetical protein ACW986_04350 [Promethearchaeota archaeon]|jgi:hypothetical protein